jgi:universal stress protein E
VALLTQASELTARLGGTLRLVCAFPLFEPWIGELGAAASYADIRASIEDEVRERIEALAGKAEVSFELLLLEEGHAAQVLARLAEEQEPALVMLGTHAREGIRGVLLGNTSERILHHVATDVVTVPSP